MKARVLPSWLLLVFFTGLAAWLGLRERDTMRTVPPPAPPPNADKPGLSPSDREAITGGHPLAAELNAQEQTPQRDLEILREMLLAFTTSLKTGNLPPLGDNEDITKALTGGNRRKLVVIPPTHPSVDARGRLLDRWGVPYHFHERSADSFDLRSAGPDKVLFTADDVTWSPQ
jgi:hypothetical protein